jgi:putative endonuclease
MHRSWVYIVCSKSGTLYIGVTSDIYLRVLQHKAKEYPGFSSMYNCDRLVF